MLKQGKQIQINVFNTKNHYSTLKAISFLPNQPTCATKLFYKLCSEV